MKSFELFNKELFAVESNLLEEDFGSHGKWEKTCLMEIDLLENQGNRTALKMENTVSRAFSMENKSIKHNLRELRV